MSSNDSDVSDGISRKRKKTRKRKIKRIFRKDTSYSKLVENSEELSESTKNDEVKKRGYFVGSLSRISKELRGKNMPRGQGLISDDNMSSSSFYYDGDDDIFISCDSITFSDSSSFSRSYEEIMSPFEMNIEAQGLTLEQLRSYLEERNFFTYPIRGEEKRYFDISYGQENISESIVRITKKSSDSYFIVEALDQQNIKEQASLFAEIARSAQQTFPTITGGSPENVIELFVAFNKINEELRDDQELFRPILSDAMVRKLENFVGGPEDDLNHDQEKIQEILRKSVDNLEKKQEIEPRPRRKKIN